MYLGLKLVRFLLAVFNCAFGTAINCPIIVMYIMQWKTGSDLSTCDKILFSIVCTNIIFSIFLAIDGLYGAFAIPDADTFLLLFILTIICFHINAWNMAWLSTFYYVRLVNSSNHFLCKIKSRFTTLVSQLIMGSILGSVLINLPFIRLTKLNAFQNSTVKTERMSDYEILVNPAFILINTLCGFLLPFTFTFLCIARCVTYLLGHILRVNLNDSFLTLSQLQVQIRAITSMVIRVLLDFTFFVLVFNFLWSSMGSYASFDPTCWCFVMIYPTTQSIILVYGNPKLRSKICGKKVTSET